MKSPRTGVSLLMDGPMDELLLFEVTSSECLPCWKKLKLSDADHKDADNVGRAESIRNG